MEWLNTILIVAGFIIVGYYLKSKNDKLREEIQSQKRILDSARTLIDLFDTERYVKYVQMSEQKFQLETEKKIKDMEEGIRKKTEDYEEKITKGKEATILFVNEWRASSRLAMNAILHIPNPEIRVRLIENMKDSISKEVFLADIDYYKKAPTPPTFEYFYNLAQSLVKKATEGQKGNNNPL